MVTSAPCSHRSAAMSCAELLEPMTTQCLPAQPSPPVCWLEWCCRPLNRSAPEKHGTSGKPDMPVASTTCLGRSVMGLLSRSTSTVHSCFASSHDARLQDV